MIRRISKNNDLKDLIKSCPSGVIDDIYSIKYYIQGYNVEVEATFTKVGEHLEVILPTSLLETLPNGILMRKAFYKVVDSSYPDGYYNLMFEDNMNIWLGEPDGEDPHQNEYVTEGELSATLSSYATQNWVSEQHFLTSETLPSDIATQSWVKGRGYLTSGSLKTINGQSIVGSGDILVDIVVSIAASELSSYGYATKSWVSEQGYLTAVPAGYATEAWVSAQGYLTSETIPSDIATQSWVSGNFLSTTALVGYATESWVQSQGYLTSETIPSDIATQSWVSSNFLSATALTGYATESWVQSQGYLTSVPSDYATKSWVSWQRYLTSSTGMVIDRSDSIFTNWDVVHISSYPVLFLGSINLGGDHYLYRGLQIEPDGFLTLVTVEPESGYQSNQHLATEDWVSSYFLSTAALNGYATESWVSSNFVSTARLSNYATKSWVSDQGYLTAPALWGYATQSWVYSHFLYSTALNGYATESWVSSNFLSTTALTGYATESWVQSQGYLTAVPSEYATESWVQSQGYLTAVPSEYATESWVQSQGYLTAVPSEYATKSWATSEFFEESKIWTGTQSQWEQLTSAQKSLYTIALVTE